MAILKISKEKEMEMINSIQAFFLEERNEDIGDLAASIFLDFIIEKLGPEIYNQGIFDSYRYMSDRVEDLLSITK